MKYCRYKRPEKTGWLGWIESGRGNALAFVRLDGIIIWW